MSKLFFRPAARADLIEIYRHILEATDSPQTAMGYLHRIRMRYDVLLTFPESGHARDDLRPGIRILGFERRVAIVYKVLMSGDVEIGRIFYGGRDYEALVSEANW